MVDGPGQFQLRAVKTISMPAVSSQTDRALYKRELEAMAKFSQTKYSDQFVKFHGWFTSPGLIHIAMEYCELGDLDRYLLSLSNTRLPEPEAQDVTYQILNALTSMHQETFCHGDLKLANILIITAAPSWWVKLADFGLSKRNGVGANNTTTAKGTPNYMPPELLGYKGNPREADPYPVDMWCLGQVGFRLATGRAMFASQADLSRYFYGQTTFRSHLPGEYQLDEAFVGYLESLLAQEPRTRPSSENSLHHPWVLSIRREHPDIHDAQDEASGHDWFSDVLFSDVSGEDTQQTTISLQGAHTPRPLSANATAMSGKEDEASAAWPADTTNLSSIKSQTEVITHPPGPTTTHATVTSLTQDEASAVWPTNTTTLVAPHIQTQITTAVSGQISAISTAATAVSSQPSIATPGQPLQTAFRSEAEKHIAFGDECLVAGKYDEAVAEYTKGIELEPLSASHLEKRSGAYWCLSNWNGVMDDCLKIRELDPKNQYALAALFTILVYAMGSPEYALPLLDHIKPSPPEQEIKDARMMKATIDEARELLDKGGDVKPVFDKLDKAQSRLWRSDGLRQAKAITERLVRRRPTNVAFLILHARVQYLSGDFHLGTRHLRKARETGVADQAGLDDIKKWLDIGEKLGSLISQAKRLYEARNARQAAKLYTEALQVDLKNWAINAVLLHNRALCYVEMGNYRDALGDCEMALLADPDLAGVQATKAKITAFQKERPDTRRRNAIAGRELAQYRQSKSKAINSEVETGEDSLFKSFRSLQLNEANHPSTAYSDATSTLPAATTTSHGAVISGDGCINLMIEYDGRDHITKMLLTYLDAEALDAHLRTVLGIGSLQQLKVERYSDSASTYIPLDPEDKDAYSAFHRAATVKNWFKLRVSDYIPYIRCDKCFSRITGGRHKHCYICNEGDFDICFLCIQAGDGCPGGHHMTERILQNGQFIVVPSN
uniref:Autophagy-related protein 1 n=1 Tax=Bionectria ochroleuca TaxID=29856 RepID=A0A8H7NQ58_BIOOC